VSIPEEGKMVMVDPAHHRDDAPHLLHNRPWVAGLEYRRHCLIDTSHRDTCESDPVPENAVTRSPLIRQTGTQIPKTEAPRWIGMRVSAPNHPFLTFHMSGMPYILILALKLRKNYLL
jgi:hypothetical protein